ncbi:MAG TPA: hypothetical protein VER08_03505 [Pyrinomonadaceae bacterium]|nr:hypothetical protein [Pyrinomonadaceae bacterium]
MKSHQANSPRAPRPSLIVAAFFLLALAAGADAQVSPRTRPGESQPTVAEMQRVFLERNLHITARRHAEIIRKRDADEEKRITVARQQLILEQVRKDYRAVQELNKRMLLSFLSGRPDYSVLSKDAVEIGRAADRLKQNLALPAPPPDTPKSPPTYVQGLALAPMLRVLDTRVISFVNNPFFQNPNVLDMSHTNKARRDLEDIISLSRDIRRNAVQMQKAVYKSQ